MEKTSNNQSIIKQLVAIMQEIPAIAKDRKNQQQGYNFRGIDEMYNALHPLFAKHGVIVTSKIISAEREERATKSGGAMFYVILDIEFTFHSTDGSSISSIMRGEAMDSGDKASNKAMSTAYKYALMQMFLIPTKEEKDTEAVTPPEVKTKTVAQTPAKPANQPKTESLATAGEKKILERFLQLQGVFDESTVKTVNKLLPTITEAKAADFISRMSTKAITHYLADDSMFGGENEQKRKDLLASLPKLTNSEKMKELGEILAIVKKYQAEGESAKSEVKEETQSVTETEPVVQ